MQVRVLAVGEGERRQTVDRCRGGDQCVGIGEVVTVREESGQNALVVEPAVGLDGTVDVADGLVHSTEPRPRGERTAIDFNGLPQEQDCFFMSALVRLNVGQEQKRG